MYRLAAQNLYPECIFLNLEAIPKGQHQFDLYASLDFNEQWKSLLNGQIKFGLKGGKLSLKLDDTAMAISDANFGEAFTVTSQFTPNHSSWTLTLKTSQWVFKGSLSQVKLGTITVSELPSHLTALFEVYPSDISITDAEGLWKHDISPNKHGVLERKLALFLWERRFTPYMSWVQLASDEKQIEKEIAQRNENAITPESLAELQEIIRLVYEAKTNDLRELAQIAGLHPLQDFAGGNLLAGELSGVQLGGANLYHINLRGAVLTDADFGEADLNHAKLTGVDLSGAYLGNANLSYSNLHKSSLALANLIGADLRGANLKEANLSQANLSGAKVEAALFAENLGMTEEMKESLLARGAIIS
ncbi:pentapeptide repeat-containing protein [Gloeothece verrucosa]|uniref:Pentapeptide repeat protein n=1 Tax=Gloeothece verrucosa (strain PCC 7822) TaxID=497965 RepID=E0UJK8_GLOV7|nr:pentapeptide repeat-containing protein [Gloeothece verrucosa]ADN12252.1 pentapeptide repeat protein [Gloeothece verrucosa PCC 7822]